MYFVRKRNQTSLILSSITHNFYTKPHVFCPQSLTLTFYITSLAAFAQIMRHGLSGAMRVSPVCVTTDVHNDSQLMYTG